MTEAEEKIADLRERAGQTRLALQKIASLRERRIEEARKAIYAEYAPDHNELLSEYNRLTAEADRIEREQALEAGAQHPLLGKTVTRKNYKRGFYRDTEVEERGVVELITADSEQPATRGYWSRLSIGTVAVRLLKADGKPGKTVFRLTNKWKVV